MILACWKRYTLDKNDRIISFFFNFQPYEYSYALAFTHEQRATISLKTFIWAVGMERFLTGRLANSPLITIR